MVEPQGVFRAPHFHMIEIRQVLQVICVAWLELHGLFIADHRLVLFALPEIKVSEIVISSCVVGAELQASLEHPDCLGDPACLNETLRLAVRLIRFRRIGSSRELAEYPVQVRRLARSRRLVHERRVLDDKRLQNSGIGPFHENRETVVQHIAPPGDDFLRKALEAGLPAIVAEQHSGHALAPPVVVLNRQAARRAVPVRPDVGMVEKTDPARFQLGRQLPEVGQHDVAFHVDEGVPAEDEVQGVVVNHVQGFPVVDEVTDVRMILEPLTAGGDAFFRQVDQCHLPALRHQVLRAAPETGSDFQDMIGGQKRADAGQDGSAPEILRSPPCGGPFIAALGPVVIRPLHSVSPNGIRTVAVMPIRRLDFGLQGLDGFPCQHIFRIDLQGPAEIVKGHIEAMPLHFDIAQDEKRVDIPGIDLQGSFVMFGGIFGPFHRHVEKVGQVLSKGCVLGIEGDGLPICGHGLVEFSLLAVENAEVIVRGSVIGEGSQEFP